MVDYGVWMFQIASLGSIFRKSSLGLCIFETLGGLACLEVTFHVIGSALKAHNMRKICENQNLLLWIWEFDVGIV